MRRSALTRGEPLSMTQRFVWSWLRGPAAPTAEGVASDQGASEDIKEAGDKPPITNEGGLEATPQDRGSGRKIRRGIVSSSEDGGVVPTVGGLVPVEPGALRKEGPFEQGYLMVIPTVKRPLIPGSQNVLTIYHPTVVAEVVKMIEKSKTPSFVGTFLLQKEHALSLEIDSNETQALHAEDLSKSDIEKALHWVGTRARITQVMQFNRNGLPAAHLVLHGLDLIHLDKVMDKGPPLTIQASRVKFQKPSGDDEEKTITALVSNIMHELREIMQINPQLREYANFIMQNQGGFGAAYAGMNRLEPVNIAHFAASCTTATAQELQEVLEETDMQKKLMAVLLLMKKELEISQLQQKIHTQLEEKMSANQREFMLREQMKMIKKELGEDKNDGTDALVQKFRSRLDGKVLPKEAQEAIDSEMEKFASLAKESSEYQITRNYLDWLTMLPWGKLSKDTLRLQKAKQILDRDHYGLNDVKERILELIAVGALRGSVQGKIICFVGPPGVGKTSIGRSIAEALGREFYRFSVGGLSDVAEIKGHRRTYVGAMPGKIIQCLKKVQTANPLILIDEVDKIGRGHQGDPASALLELLDPSQNGSFLDHYLDVPVDCSRVLFVCTANVTETIPGPLLDRMEVIRLSGYDLKEKLKIAEDYLVPNTMREVGLWAPLPKAEPSPETPTQPSASPAPTVEAEASPAADAAESSPRSSVPSDAEATDGMEEPSEQVGSAVSSTMPVERAEQPKPALGHPPAVKATIETSALEALIRWYCREAGVRNLQKHIEKICRKLATKVIERREGASEQSKDEPESSASAGAASAQEEEELRVTEDKLSDLVGKPPFISDRLYEGALPPGTITGLAWTALGGSVLYVEATAIPKPGLRAPAGDGTSPTPSGRASLSVTGQLGSVMKESSQISLLVAQRQFLQRLQRSPEASAGQELPHTRRSFFEEHDIHVHCPEGATPKDGPSAGVTMTTALLSLAMNVPIRQDLAMTGEISLNGKVLAVGGIKEKTIAARRAGCRVLVFPQANRRDFDELPEYLREGLEAHFVTDYDEIVPLAFPVQQPQLSLKQ